MSTEDTQHQQQTDAIRAAIFSGSRRRKFEIVEWEGHKLEVRAPTLAEQEAIRLASIEKVKGSNGKEVEVQRPFRAGVLTIIACTYLPGTNKKIFTSHDLEALMKQEGDEYSLMAALTPALARVQAMPTKAVEEELGN